MLVAKTSRKKNAWISVNRTRKFRDDLIVFGKRNGHSVFLTTFNNIFYQYEVISIPLSNGTYKIKVVSVDDLKNENTGSEGTQIIDFFPLPPKNLEVSLSGNDVTLSWEHSVDGAPDFYVIYGNNGSGLIDKSAAIAAISGSLLTYTFTVVDGQWIFVVESKKNGVESDTLEIVTITVPVTAAEPPKPGLPGTSGPNAPDIGLFAVTGLVLENISVGEVKINFYWFFGSVAASFNIYHDDATGTIDYSVPKFSFSRLNGFIQNYTTSQLHSSDTNKTYKFVVRAVSQDGVEEKNTDEYEIDVDGVAPDNVADLQLDAVY